MKSVIKQLFGQQKRFPEERRDREEKEEKDDASSLSDHMLDYDDPSVQARIKHFEDACQATRSKTSDMQRKLLEKTPPIPNFVSDDEDSDSESGWTSFKSRFVEKKDEFVKAVKTKFGSEPPKPKSFADRVREFVVVVWFIHLFQAVSAKLSIVVGITAKFGLLTSASAVRFVLDRSTWLRGRVVDLVGLDFIPPHIAEFLVQAVLFLTRQGWFQLLELATYVNVGFQAFASGVNRTAFMLNLIARLLTHLTVPTEVRMKFQQFRVRALTKVKGYTFEAGDEDAEDSAIYSFLSGLLFGTAGESMYLRKLSERIRLATGIFSVYRILVELYTRLVPNPIHERFVAWEREVTIFLNDKPELLSDTIKDSIVRLDREGRELRDIYFNGDRRVKEQVPMMFMSTLTEFQKYVLSKKTALKGRDERAEPVTVLSGHVPGTGKSELNQLIAKYMAEEIADAHWEDGAKDLCYFYGKNKNSRMDGASGTQKILVMDDLFMLRDKKENAYEAQLFCAAASSQPFYPDMAEMSEKRSPCNFDLVLVTTNLDLHESTEVGLQNTAAVLRRADFRISIPKFERSAMKDNPTILDFPTIHIIGRKDQTVDEWVSGVEFCKMVRDTYRAKQAYFQSRTHDWSVSRDAIRTHCQREELLKEIRTATDGEHEAESYLDWAELGIEFSKVVAGFSSLLIFMYLLYWIYKRICGEDKESAEESFATFVEEDEPGLAEGATYVDRERKITRRRGTHENGHYQDKQRKVTRKKLKGSAEAGLDQAAQDVVARVAKNTCVVKVVSRGQVYAQDALGIAKDTILLNTHALVGVLDDPEAQVVLWRVNIRIAVFLKSCKLIRCSHDRTFLIHPKFGHFRSIFKHFVKESDLPKSDVTVFSPILQLHRDRNSVKKENGYIPLQTQLIRSYSYHTSGAAIKSDLFQESFVTQYTEGFFRAAAHSGPGYCGSLYLSTDTHVQRKLMGVHFAKLQENEVGFFPITQEFLEDKLGDRIIDTFEEDSGVTFTGESECSVELEAEKNFPAGFIYLGNTEKGTHMHPTSALRESVLQRHFESKEVVAHRVAWIKDGVRINPPDYFFGKNIQPALVDPELLRPIVETIVNRMPKPALGFPSVLSRSQSLNGMPHSNFGPIRYDTSGGYRMRHLCKQGKRPYLKVELTEEGNDISASEKARRDLRGRLEAFRRRRVYSVAKDAQKDERYSKNKEDKYRVVSTDDVANLIIYRRYLGAFLEAARRQQPLGFSQVGIDAWGPAFSTMYMYLEEFGCDAMELDGKAWDFILPWEVIEAGVQVILKWYAFHYPDMSDEEQDIRENVVRSYLIHYHIFQQRVYGRVGGTLSGMPATAECNGIAGEIIFRVIFSVICPGKDFDAHVRVVLYGDDALATVRGAPEFNQVTFAAFAKKALGMTFTTAEKEAPTDAYVPLSTASFISRRFRMFDGVPVGALSLETIREIPLWVRTGVPSEAAEQVCQNVDMALREAFLHGRTEFETMKREFNSALMRENLPPSKLDFSKLALEWKARA